MAITRTVAGQEVTLDKREIERRLRKVLPEPLRDHYVVVAGRRFPPKQVLAMVTGLDRADFTTHQARRVLQRAGFTVGRVGESGAAGDLLQSGLPHQGREAAALRPFAGQWVAQRGLEVVVSADTPEQVVTWVNQHGVGDAVVFRVPRDQSDADPTSLR